MVFIVRERKLSGGGSTRRGFFLLSNTVALCYVLVPDFPSLGRGIKKFIENNDLN